MQTAESINELRSFVWPLWHCLQIKDHVDIVIVAFQRVKGTLKCVKFILWFQLSRSNKTVFYSAHSLLLLASTLLYCIAPYLVLNVNKQFSEYHFEVMMMVHIFSIPSLCLLLGGVNSNVPTTAVERDINKIFKLCMLRSSSQNICRCCYEYEKRSDKTTASLFKGKITIVIPSLLKALFANHHNNMMHPHVYS